MLMPTMKADDAGDPELGPCADDLTIMANWRPDVRNDDALNFLACFDSRVGSDRDFVSLRY
jgi:hypothetical protein